MSCSLAWYSDSFLIIRMILLLLCYKVVTPLVCPWTKSLLVWTDLLCSLTAVVLREGLQMLEFILGCTEAQEILRTKRVGVGSWLHMASRLQCDSAESHGLGVCTVNQLLQVWSCSPGDQPYVTSCNTFVYFIWKAAFFCPASINAEWHCAYVFK